MKIPTLKEMLDYQESEPELSGVDVPFLFKLYDKTARKNRKGEKVWVDKTGQIIGNWKNKLWTSSRYNPPMLCGICQQPASKYQMREGKRFYLCPLHLPKETPKNPNPVLPKKNSEMIVADKVQEQYAKLKNFGKI